MSEDKLPELADIKLTLKQRMFIKRFFETGNGTQAAMDVYDCKDRGTAGNIASENLRKLQAPFKTYLESKGLSYNDLYETGRGGLQATKTENNKEVPDWPTRHKFMETASRWLGVEKKEEVFGVETKSGNQTFKVIFKRDLE